MRMIKSIIVDEKKFEIGKIVDGKKIDFIDNTCDEVGYAYMVDFGDSIYQAFEFEAKVIIAECSEDGKAYCYEDYYEDAEAIYKSIEINNIKYCVGQIINDLTISSIVKIPHGHEVNYYACIDENGQLISSISTADSVIVE